MSFASHSTVLCLPDSAADEDLACRAGQFLLTRQPTIRRQIRLAAERGVITIEGVVRTFYERQLAVACVSRVAGVRQVVDLLVVMDEARHRAGRRPGAWEARS